MCDRQLFFTIFGAVVYGVGLGFMALWDSEDWRWGLAGLVFGIVVGAGYGFLISSGCCQ